MKMINYQPVYKRSNVFGDDWMSDAHMHFTIPELPRSGSKIEL
jgi:hypothetical protein